MKSLSRLTSAITATARKLYGRFIVFVATGNAARLGAAAMVLAAGSFTLAHAQMTATNPVFPATAVGSVATPQTMLLTTTSAETITSITVPASQGNKQEYTVGGVSGCAVDGSTVNPAGTVCRVPITFAPAYPGARVAPLRVVTGAGNINFALSATGNGPLSVLSPGEYTVIAGGCTTNCAAQDADGVLASTELFSRISDMRVNSAGDIYFIDTPGLRMISGSTGIVTTIAGVGSGSNSLTLAPLAIALDPRGNIDAAEFNTSYGNAFVQQVNGATGAVTTIAGKSYQSTSTYPNVPTPGPATQSPLPALTDVASDASGNVYVGTYSQILRIDAATGILSYVAGTPNVRNYAGDGGLAITALVNGPTGLAFDPAGNLYFSDSLNLVIRRIDAVTGIITTVAGNPNGTENEGYVGPPTGTLIAPLGLAFDSAGNLYLNDAIDGFLGIRRIDAATNTMTTIAGSDYYEIKGANGLRATDRFNVSGFALDSLGNLITFSSGAYQGSISKVDTSVSAISFPYSSNSVTYAFPFVGTAYPNAKAETVSVTNIGNTALSLLSLASGSDPTVTGAAYNLDDPSAAGCPSVAAGAPNATLAPGTSCFLAVDFTPTLVGANTGQIALTDNSLNVASSTKTISLSGNGEPLPITLSSTALTFPDTVLGASSPTQTITVNNVGGYTTLMVAVSITGANASSFSQTNTCGTYIFAASSCTITITFSPTAVATGLNAVVSLASDYPTPPPSATLTGNGVAPATLVPPTVTATLLPAAPYYSDTVTVTTSLIGPAGQIQPTGTITYKVDTGGTSTASLTAGAAASLAYLQIVPQIPGTHTLSFTYSGDSNYASTIATPQIVTFTVADRPFAFIAGNYYLNPYITDDLNGSGLVYDYYASGVATDPLGNVYLSTGIASGGTPGIRKIDTNQILSTVPVTGLGANTQLATDGAGNLYIADPAKARIVVYSKAGVQTVLPTSGLISPAALMFDALNNSLVIADTTAGTIVNYNLATSTQTTLLSGLTKLSAMVATDGKGDLFYVQNNILLESAPGTTPMPIFGEFGGLDSYATASPSALAFNEATGDLYVGKNGSYTQNVIRVDKLHHAIYLGQPELGQLNLDGQGELYAPNLVISTGAAADSGPGIAMSSAPGYSGGSPQSIFAVPYGHLLRTAFQSGVPGAFGATNSTPSGRDSLSIGLYETSLTANTDNGLSLSIPLYGIGFAPVLTADLGTVSTAPFGTFGSIGGLAYNEQVAGSAKIYVTDKTQNTVSSIGFYLNPAGASAYLGTSQTLAFAGLKAPTQISVDGVLDVYVLDSGALNGGSRIVRLDYANHQTNVYTADTGDAAGLLGSVTAFTLDGATNLYLGGTDKNGKGVIVRQDTFGNESKRISNINTPTLLAIDALHNLFYTDAAGNLTRVDAAGNATTLATGLAAATSLSIDASDTAYLTSASGQTITTVSAAGVAGAITVPGTTHPALAVAEDLGSLFVADSALQQVLVDARSKGNINFGSVAVGATAAQNDMVHNVGNLALAPFTLNSAAPFSIVPATSNGCLDSANTSPTALVPGSSCGVQLRYSPTAAATDAGTAKLSVPNDATYGYNTNVDATWKLSGIASATVAATATLTPATANFGSVQAGGSASLPLTLTNTGTTAITVTGVAISSPLFTVSSQTCGTTLAAGANCTYTLTYTPTATGAATSTFSVTDTAGIQSSALSGTGQAAGSLAITPTTQAFPATSVGATSAIQTSAISNTTAQAIYLSSGSLTDANDFTQSDNCNGLLAAGKTCTVSFTFTPKSAGALTSTYAIHDLNNPGTPLTVVLSGTGAGTSAATLQPNPILLQTTVGTPAIAQVATLTNTGTAALNISSVVIGGPNAAAFNIVTNACGTVLAAGASCNITIGLAATTYGHYTGTLTATDNASPTTQVSGINGYISGVPNGVLTPTSLTYTATAGATAPVQTATVTSNGTAPLSIFSIAITGANASAFSETDNCPTVLAIGSSCTLNIVFTAPAAAGTSTASLVVTDNSGLSITPQLKGAAVPLDGPPPATQSIVLTGNSTAALVPQAVLSAQYLNFTTVPNTQAYNQTLTLSNPGTGTLNIGSILLTGANTSSFAIVTNACGATLNAGASCTITLGCTAIVTGTYTASLTVTDNATPPTQSAYLTCTVAGTAQASLAPAAVSFGNVNVGAKSAASTITLTNAGTAALGINSISLQGTNAANYAIAGNACGLSLAAGASCAVTVTFSPTAAGSTSATLTVIDAVGTQTSALSGTGAATVAPDFTIAATPAQKAYRGTSVSYTVQLTSLLPSNPFSSAVTLSATGLPAGTTVSFAPATLVPGASTASTSVMTVTIPPLAAALHVPASPSRWPGGKLPEGATVLTALALGFMRRRKARGLQRLLSAVLMLGGMATAAMLSGCGASNGFGVPTTTSVITVTATSGTTVHSTQVTLTIL